MKLKRKDWKNHGRIWRYKETPTSCFGYIEETATHEFEARYLDITRLVDLNNPDNLWRYAKFNDIQTAFAFCEAKYKQEIKKRQELFSKLL